MLIWEMLVRRLVRGDERAAFWARAVPLVLAAAAVPLVVAWAWRRLR
jgi:hypothetical protein